MPIYMKIEGLPLRGTGKGMHSGWIVLESCQLGVNRHVTNATGSGRGAPPSEIIITKSQDEASTALFRMSMWGEGKKVTIDFANGDNVYMTLELQNTLISNYSVSGHGGYGKGPTESLTLNSTGISYDTKAAPASGETKNWKDIFHALPGIP